MLSNEALAELRNHVDILISHSDLGARMFVNAVPNLLDHIDEQAVLIDKLTKAPEGVRDNAVMTCLPLMEQNTRMTFLKAIQSIANDALADVRGKLNGET